MQVQLQEKQILARDYKFFRDLEPTTPARVVLQYIKSDLGMSFKEFVCETTTGHSWSYSGDDYGDGRCLCSNCGADGDS